MNLLELEAACKEKFNENELDTLLLDAGFKVKGFPTVAHRLSGVPVSDRVVKCAIAPYLACSKGAANPSFWDQADSPSQAAFMDDAEKVSAELDPDDLAHCIEKMIQRSYGKRLSVGLIKKGYRDPRYLFPLCRYGSDRQIAELIKAVERISRERSGWLAKKAADRLADMLLLSATHIAKMWSAEQGHFYQYAKLRGMDPVRCLLSTNYVVKNTGDDHIDLDPQLKKAYLAAINEMIVTGESLSLAVWSKLSRAPFHFFDLTETLVWEQGEKRFIGRRCCQQGVKVDGELIELDPEHPVRLAHPCELPREEVLRWRHWLKANHIKQAFIQMDLPIYDLSVVREDRFDGVIFDRDLLEQKLDRLGQQFELTPDGSLVSRGICEIRFKITGHGRGEIVSFRISEQRSRLVDQLIRDLDLMAIRWKLGRNDPALRLNLDAIVRLDEIDELIKLAREEAASAALSVLLEYRCQTVQEAAETGTDVMDEFSLE